MNAKEFRHHVARLGWTVPFTAAQFARSEQTARNWASGRAKIPAGVASFLATYSDPISKPEKRPRLKKGEPPSNLTPAHLKAFRHHFALTQHQAAHLAGVARATWNRWEKQHSPVPAYLLDILKRAVQQLKEETTP